MALTFVITANGVSALFTSLVGALADASGLSLLAELVARIAGNAMPVLPCQASLAVVTFAALVPLGYAWLTLPGQLNGRPITCVALASAGGRVRPVATRRTLPVIHTMPDKTVRVTSCYPNGRGLPPATNIALPQPTVPDAT